MSNKTNKTPKKNSVAIEWPTTHFTIDDVQQQNTNIINITLRFRVNKAVENKELVTIGKVKPAIGRPRLVFAKANPSKELLEAAAAAGVLPIEDTTPKASVTVAEVKTTKASVKTTPAATESTVASN